MLRIIYAVFVLFISSSFSFAQNIYNVESYGAVADYNLIAGYRQPTTAARTDEYEKAAYAADH
jgi:hypothetical protein